MSVGAALLRESLVEPADRHGARPEMIVDLVGLADLQRDREPLAVGAHAEQLYSRNWSQCFQGGLTCKYVNRARSVIAHYSCGMGSGSMEQGIGQVAGQTALPRRFPSRGP
jgi:hypothetical protein